MAVIFGSFSLKCRDSIKSNIIRAKICHRINANLIPCIHICSTASPKSQESLKLHNSNVFLSALIWYIILVLVVYNLLFDWTWYHPPSLRKISLTTIAVGTLANRYTVSPPWASHLHPPKQPNRNCRRITTASPDVCWKPPPDLLCSQTNNRKMFESFKNSAPIGISVAVAFAMILRSDEEGELGDTAKRTKYQVDIAL